MPEEVGLLCSEGEGEFVEEFGVDLLDEMLGGGGFEEALGGEGELMGLMELLELLLEVGEGL